MPHNPSPVQSQRCNVTGAPPPSYPPCTLVPRRRVSIMPQIPTIFSVNRVKKSLLIPAGAPPPWTTVPPLPSKPTTLCGPKPHIPVFFSVNSVRKSLLSPAGAPPPELRRRRSAAVGGGAAPTVKTHNAVWAKPTHPRHGQEVTAWNCRTLPSLRIHPPLRIQTNIWPSDSSRH